MKQWYKLSEVADLLGVSKDTIKRREKKGLITSKRDENNNYRMFHIDNLKKFPELQYMFEEDSDEKRYVKPNQDYHGIELFAGAGGLALGLEKAGLKSKLLVEIDKNAAETLSINRQDWNVICGDVAEMDYSEYSVDFITGGFPCQAFSYAGNKGGFNDTRGTLFFEFARAIKKIKPKIFVGENVRGLMSHEKGRTIEIMINVLMELGYNIQVKVLKAINYDVPQKRERTFIVGTLPGYRFKFPRQRNYMLTLKDALENVPESMGAKYNDQKAEILKHVPPGGYWRDLPIDLQKIYMKKSFYLGGGKTGMARRMSWDEPCLTLTTSPQQKQTERCHPDETRPFTVREYARIQTFPDEWQFAGAMTSQYKQIGNAVPVNLAEHVGREIVRTLNQETKFHDETTCVADICSICKLPEKFFKN